MSICQYVAGNVIWKYSQTKFSSIIEYLNRKRKIVGKYTMAFQIIKVNLPIKEYNLEFNSFFLPWSKEIPSKGSGSMKTNERKTSLVYSIN